MNIGTLKLRQFAIAQFAVVTTVMALGLFSYLFTHFADIRSLAPVMRLLDVGVEQSLPTFVSVINLLLASVLAGVVYYYERIKEHRGAAYWLFLSLLFLFLSFDEFAGIHEKFGRLYEILVRRELIAPSLNSHKWVPFGVLFVVVVGVILLPFLRQLPKDTLRYFVIAGVVFITGAVGLEYLGAVMLEYDWVESKKDMLYLTRRLFEEGFEMYGIAFFNWALYREILRRKI